jgi:hypothetical protein
MKNLRTIIFFVTIYCLALIKSLICQTIITVPDANFRKALLALSTTENPITEVAGAEQVSVQNPDDIYDLYIDSDTISSLTGIEAFSNLSHLSCALNKLTTIDVSHNTNLVSLWVYGNNLSSIDVSKNVMLGELYVGMNPISAIDLSNNPLLLTLYCHHTNITSLDLRANTKLTAIKANDSKICSIDVSKCTNLKQFECYNNQIVTFDLSKNTELVKLDCYNNNLLYLNLPHTKTLAEINCSGNFLYLLDLTEMSSSPSIDVSSNPDLSKIFVSDLTAATGIIVKDASAQLVQPGSVTTLAAITSGAANLYIMGSSGAEIETTDAGSSDGTILAATETNPTVSGTLPSDIEKVLTEKYWQLTPAGLSGYSYSMTLDLSAFTEITDFTKVRILQRTDATQPWQNLSSSAGIVTNFHKPYITLLGLTIFNEFAVAVAKESALPVELKSFTAIQSTVGVKIEWTTATEINSHCFTIEKRQGTEALWTKIGEVAASGNSNSEKNYSFIDAQYLCGAAVYYRLKETDKDGQTKYFEVIEFSGGMLPSEFTLYSNYPNPFNPSTVIRYELPTTCYVTLKIYDVLGNEIETLVRGEEKAGAYRVTAGLQGRASGIYIYRIQAGKFSAAKKMLLVK